MIPELLDGLRAMIGAPTPVLTWTAFDYAPKHSDQHRFTDRHGVHWHLADWHKWRDYHNGEPTASELLAIHRELHAADPLITVRP